MKTSSTLLLLALGSLSAITTIQAAAPVTPITAPPQVSRSAAGNSFNPIFSGDGRFLFFVSQANNLVTNDDRGLSLDLFIHNLATRQTALVSVNTNSWGGADADVVGVSVSSNGQYVAFQSTAGNLTAGDTNGKSDVFVRDLVAGVTRLVSVGTNGTQSARGISGAPVISADGRWVVFESNATNLAAVNHPYNKTQLYVRDCLSNATTIISVSTNGRWEGFGTSENASLTADGRWVAFVSTATNLAAGATSGRAEILLRDLQAGVTTWISSNAAPFFAGVTAGYQCVNPVFNADGGQLIFQAFSKGTNTCPVFWRNLSSGATICVASNSSPDSPPSLSADGRLMAYVDYGQIHVWDNLAQSNRLISVSHDGQNPGNDFSITPVLSPDGRKVAFLSRATDLLSANAPNSNAPVQIYVRDLAAETTHLVTATQPDRPAADIEPYVLPAISPDGQWLAFESADANLVDGDENRASDIFLHRLETATNELVTVIQEQFPARTGTANAFIQSLCLSTNGRHALVASFANDLGLADDDPSLHLYWMDLNTGSNRLISLPTNAASPYGAALFQPALSADGNTAVFLRQPDEGYFLRLDGGSLTLFSVNSTGAPLSGLFPLAAVPDWSHSLSADGRWFVFSAANASPVASAGGTAYRSIILRDLTTGTNFLVSHNSISLTNSATGHSWQPQWSPDGQWILFATRAADIIPGVAYGLMAYNRHTNGFRLIASAGAAVNIPTNAVFSANSRYIVFEQWDSWSRQYTLCRHDLLEEAPTNQNVLVATNALNAAVSADGQVIAFRSEFKPYQVYVRDLATNTLELISAASDGITPGNGSSDVPQISPDGRYVIFTSKAGNLAPNDGNGFTDLFLHDRTLGLTYLLSANPKTGRSGNGPSITPVLSADGSTLVFASEASDLTDGDYNGKRDIFVLKLTSGDSDSDGINDGWEMAYFGHLNRNGAEDFDSDGLTDFAEYRAGTDPTNEDSCLSVLVMARPGDRQATLLWPVRKASRYKVQFKRSVTDADWTDLNADITITGNTAMTTDPEAGLDAARFYRIVLLP